MAKPNGLLVWGEDGDLIADFIGSRLQTKPPASIEVKRYEGPRASREEYLKMKTYANFRNIVKKLADENSIPIIAKERIEQQLELKYGDIGSKIEEYVDKRNKWITDLFKEYEPQGIKFEINLHSKECENPYPKSPEKTIDFIVSHHKKNAEAKHLLQEYESVFNKRFKNDHFSSVSNITSIPPVMMIELISNPFAISSYKAETMVRSFLKYLVENY